MLADDRFRLPATLTALLLALAACGGDDTTEPSASDEVAADGAGEEAGGDPEDADGAADAEGAPAVGLGATDHGDVLVDADGMTLYVFDPDEQGPSTCTDACADNWPPLEAPDGVTATDGVDEGLLDTVERDDGTPQAAYDGWPLYRWVGDDAPGEATGQGVEEIWWVIDAEGTVLRADAVEGDEAEADEEEAPARTEY